jgi:hypothetical protein
MNSDDAGSSLVAAKEAYSGCLADCGLHKHYSNLRHPIHAFQYLQRTLHPLVTLLTVAENEHMVFNNILLVDQPRAKYLQPCQGRVIICSHGQRLEAPGGYLK